MAEKHFRVHRGQLLPAITAVFDAVETRATIPILANILLQQRGQRLFVRGTDLNIEIEAVCDLLDEGDGTAITLAGAHLRDIVRNLPETAEIEFLPGAFDGQVRLRAGRASFSVFSLPERDFPSMAKHVKGEAFTIDVNAMSRAFGKVLYAVEHASSDRTFLTGICLHPTDEGNKIAVVGCNGRSLAVVRVEAKTRADFRTIILPVKAAAAIRKYMGEGRAEAAVTISDTLLQIECDDIRIITNLIDGTYPDYMRVVPTTNDKMVKGSIDAMAQATRRVCLVSDDTSKEALVLTANRESLRFQLSSRKGEDAADEMAVEFGGNEFRIGFNGKIFEETLKSIVTSDVEIHFGESMTAAIFKPTTALDEFYLLSPMGL